MSQSTPINQIRRNLNDSQNAPNPMIEQNMGKMINPNEQPNQLNDNELVNDILKEMGDSPGNDNISDINVNTLQYTMDNSQVPPEKLAYNQFDEQSKMLDDNNNQASQPSINLDHNLNNNNHNNNNLLNNINLSLNTDTLKNKILKFVKIPLTVFILSIILGLPQINRFIFRLLPQLLKESGEITIWGIILKSLILTIFVVLVQLLL